MKISYRSYPHPVLTYFSDDLVKCAFQATVKITTLQNLYRLDVDCVLSNPVLCELIEMGYASYALHVECSATRYRDIKASSKSSFTHDLSALSVEGNVDLCVLVIAVKDIPNYSNPNFHKDYQSLVFKISRGDVLAVAEDRSFMADNERDSLKKIPSIFTIARNKDSKSKAIDFDLTGQKITILLPDRQYTQYSQLAQATHLHSILASLVVVPVLTEVLSIVSTKAEADEEYGSRRWYRVICNRCQEIHIPFPLLENSESMSAVALAQKILGDPCENSLSDIQRIAVED